MIQTAVAFFVFNRPTPTQKVFQVIQKAKPQRLYVIADGPRQARAGEAEKCRETRGLLNQIDWPCEVHTNFSERNLGCKWRMASGLDWVFSKEEQAIILEDDCVPDISFFAFCEELLTRYAQDKRIMTVCGGNYQDGKVRNADSYYYSQYPRIWGWASWRRAWKYYDINMQLWPILRDERWLLDICSGNVKAAQYFHNLFETAFHQKIDTWDYQWLFAHFAQRGMTIIPNRNLISNIGFGEDATHTTIASDPSANLAIAPMSFPLKHPLLMVENYIQDNITLKKDFRIV